MRRGFEIEIAEAEGDAAPNIRAAARHPNATHPEERLIFWRRVWLFEIVCEPIRRVFIAHVEDGLHRTRLANRFGGHVAVFQGKRGLMFREIFVRLRAARFEERDFEAGFGKALACPAAGSARANDDDIELFTR